MGCGAQHEMEISMRQRPIAALARPPALLALLAIACVSWSTAGESTTYFTVEKTCPIGGERFEHADVGSDTRWGALPDGMPLGAGSYPFRPPQCPGNGLVMYRDFKPAELVTLEALLVSPDYARWRAAKETMYYLAFETAKRLGDPPTDQAWLLLQATWEAKNDDDQARADRYNAQFAALVASLPAEPDSMTMVALRARAANALRELGRMAEAEAMRAGTTVSAAAGGAHPEDVDNRKGWAAMLKKLAAPIARGDRSRAPSDLTPQR